MKQILTSVIIFLFIQFSFAQKADTIRTTVIIISNDANTSSYNKPKRKHPKNAIKVGLFRPIYGEATLYYDRELADFFSLQANVGLTFRNLYYDMHSIFRGSSKYGSFDDYTHRKAGLGVCAGIEPRFFFANDGFEGWYISFPLGYAVHNYKANKINLDDTYSDETVKESVKSIYFSGNIGVQPHFDKLLLDFYFGLGLWNRNETRLNVDEFNLLNNIVNFKATRLYYTIGLSFGGFF
jgi:hypothetical protein